MTYALIDNSTLTAVQRLSGGVLTKSKDSTDTDIVALENYLQAILFYDRIVAVDDYIPAHRDSRITAFPNIDFLSKSDFNLSDIEQQAKEKADSIRPEIRGGEFANDDFKKLIELLQTHIVCTWDISSSVYHLNLKGLTDGGDDFQKYGNLAASIFSELGDAADSGQRTNGDVALVDRFGNPIGKGYKVPGARWGDGTSSEGASGAIRAFVAALVWLANRSVFYSLTAKYLQADTFLYPIRQAYQQNYLSQTCNYGFSYAKNIVDHFSSVASEDLISIHNAGLSGATSATMPMFSAWLAKQTGDPAQIVAAAYSMRNNPEFVEAREQMREIRRLFDESELASANKQVLKLVTDFNKSSNSLRVKYGLQTRQGIPVTKLVHVYNTYAAVNGLPKAPAYNFKVKLPEFFYNFKTPRGFNAVYRNLTDDLSTVWSLGEARDILGSKVQKDKGAITYNPKQEMPVYRHVHSQYKSPM
ncbi:TPA: hypothetical protein I7114_21435 [Vibrio vulnificus]|uniref:hypothetical protein n=1 Tax=Vibrio vulnificus TaxID=672 RepID=UPI001A1BCF21|nr:hypothetical protein [Vibrio vulnificus]MCG6299038.1 hypothetical protein [Vibrio vulnificus]HAS6069260.1 hypothetical protein [Vibrio vulnificus]HDY7662564.1 hypothetical protein [Vibrio vulnificus]HDY7790930.1 hypothetical protein [Vibrio vulnificus]HDY7924171.1 hypothetical protein [Vibrio vulnificus]